MDERLDLDAIRRRAGERYSSAFMMKGDVLALLNELSLLLTENDKFRHVLKNIETNYIPQGYSPALYAEVILRQTPMPSFSAEAEQK